MKDFFNQLPHLEPYGDPQYFVYVILATLPIFIGLFFKKRFAWYEILVSLFFIVTMLIGGKTNQLYPLIAYVLWQIVLVFLYKGYRKKHDSKWIFYIVSFLSLFPIMFVKVDYTIHGGQPLLGFLGISYLTFRSVGMIIELRDGVIKEFTLWEFLRFLLFMPTFSSGPIDRFKRFNENYLTIPSKDELVEMLDESVKFIMWGFLYKFILAHILGEIMLPPLKNLALQAGGIFYVSARKRAFIRLFVLVFDNQIKNLIRAVHNMCRAERFQRFATAKAPGNRNTIHTAVSCGLHVNFRVTDIHCLFRFQAQGGKHGKDHIRRRFPTNVCALSLRFFEQPFKVDTV